MANVLDENVVILKFDNSDFQKNTQDSISSLDKLKASLDKSGSGEGLKGLGKAAKSFNLDNMSNAVDKVNKRFSLFGIAGMATINRLTNSAITATKNMVTAIPRQIMQGGWQRALNIENAKFMIEGLGHSWEDTWDKAGNKVEGVKKSVLAAVNQTRYGLDEAAGIAGQLLASNVKNGEELTSALQSISGLASVTNSQYSDIGRIYAQVAGQGRLMGDQLLQISSRGINAAAAIQEYLNKNAKIKDEALAAAIATGKQTTKMKELSQQATLSEGDVRDMVSAGAISFDVFSKSMAGFWDQAQRANETYEGSLANVNASLSRMGAKFESFKLEALKNIFNTLLPILSRVEDLLDPIAEKFGKVSEAATDFLRESVLNPIGKALGAENLFHGFGKEAEKAGKQTKKANDEVGKSTKDLGNKLKVTTKEWKAALEIWNKGTYGNGQKRVDAIRKLGMSYENVQGIINKFYETGFDWKKTKGFYDVADATEKAADGNKEIGESAEKAEPKLSKLGMAVKGILNVVTTVKNVLIAFKNVLSAAWQIAQKLFSGAATGILGGFYKLSEYLAKASSSLVDFTKKLKENPFEKLIGKFPNLYRGIMLVAGAFKSIGNLFGSLFNNIKRFFTLFTQSEGFVKLKDVFKELLETLSDKIWLDALPKISGIFGEITKFGSSGNVVERLANLFSKLAGGLADFISKVREGQNPFKLLGNAIRGLKDNLSFKGVQGINGKGGVFAKISDVLNFDSIGKIGEKIKGLNIGEKLKGMFTGLVDLVKNADIIEKLKSLDFAGFFKALGEKLGEVDWDRIIELAAKIGGLVAAFVALRDMRKVTDAAVGTMGSVSGFFTSLSGVSDVIKKKIKMESFTAMAIAIAILVGCIVALTLIPTKKLIPAMAGVLGILGAMTAIIAYMNSDKFDAEKLKSVGIAFAGMGVSIALLGVGMALIAKLKVGDIIKAGIAIAAFVGMLVLASKLSGDIKGAGGAFIGLATAVNLLLVAMVAFAALSLAVIVKGGLVILGLVTSLALAARIANGSKTGGFVSLANAVNLLIPAITAFALMPTSRILKGGLAVVGLVTALGLAARIADGGSLKGMTGISVAVGVLAVSLMLLSKIDTEKLIVSGSAMVSLMLSLSLAAKLAQKSMAGLLSMAVVLGMMSVALLILTSMEVDTSLKVCASLSKLAISLAAAMALFYLVGPQGSAIGVAGLAVAIAGVGAILYAIGRLDAALEKYDIEGFIRRGIPILTAIASGMGQVIGAFASGLLAQLASGGLPVIANNLSKFMDALNPFFDSVKDRKSIAAAVDSIKEMAVAFKELGKANLANAAAEWLGGDTVDMEEFGDQLSEFAKGFKKFAKTAGKISDDDLASAYTVAKIAGIFGEVQSVLGTTGGMKGLVMGNKQDLGEFGESISDIVDVVGDLIIKLRKKKFTEDDVQLFGPITDIIKAFAGLELPEGTSLKTLTIGKDVDLATFGEQIGSMVEGISTLIVNLREAKFTEDDVTLIDPLIKIIQTFAGLELPEGMSYKKIFVGGPEDLATFADTLVTFAEKFQEFVEKTADISPEEFEAAIPRIDPIASAVTAMANAAQNVPEGGGVKQAFVGGQDLGLFGIQLFTFALTIKPFIKRIAALEIPGDFQARMSKLVDIVNSMSEVAKAIPDDEGVFTKLGRLVKLKIDEAAITSITQSVKAVDTNTEGLDATRVQTFATAVKALGEVVGDMKSLKGIPSGYNLPALASNIKSMVDTMGDVKVKGLKSKASSVKQAASDMAKAANSSIKTDSSKGSKSGSDLGDAMVKGLNGKQSSVKAAAKRLVSSAESGVKGNSGSFYSAGYSCAEGFASGVRNGRYLASSAGSSIGKAALAAAKAAVDSSSPSKEFMKLGRFSSEGFAIGMLQLKDKVKNASYEMATTSIKGANDALSAMNDLSSPVITPVVDLSNVRTGAQTIDALLSANRAIDANAIVAANLSLQQERSQAMDRLVDMMGKPREDRNITNYNNFNVDGAANPEDFAYRVMRSLEVGARTM